MSEIELAPWRAYTKKELTAVGDRTRALLMRYSEDIVRSGLIGTDWDGYIPYKPTKASRRCRAMMKTPDLIQWILDAYEAHGVSPKDPSTWLENPDGPAEDEVEEEMQAEDPENISVDPDVDPEDLEDDENEDEPPPRRAARRPRRPSSGPQVSRSPRKKASPTPDPEPEEEEEESEEGVIDVEYTPAMELNLDRLAETVIEGVSENLLPLIEEQLTSTKRSIGTTIGHAKSHLKKNLAKQISGLRTRVDAQFEQVKEAQILGLSMTVGEELAESVRELAFADLDDIEIDDEDDDEEDPT